MYAQRYTYLFNGEFYVGLRMKPYVGILLQFEGTGRKYVPRGKWVITEVDEEAKTFQAVPVIRGIKGQILSHVLEKAITEVG